MEKIIYILMKDIIKLQLELFKLKREVEELKPRWLNMELMVEEVKRIEEGKHTGVIKAVEYREKPFKYIDLVIEFEQGKKVKVGYPATVTSESKLGKLLLDFGTKLEVNKKVSLIKEFVNKPVSFMTLNTTTDRGTFAHIVANSLRRIEWDIKKYVLLVTEINFNVKHVKTGIISRVR